MSPCTSAVAETYNFLEVDDCITLQVGGATGANPDIFRGTHPKLPQVVTPFGVGVNLVFVLICAA